MKKINLVILVVSFVSMASFSQVYEAALCSSDENLNESKKIRPVSVSTTVATLKKAKPGINAQRFNMFLKETGGTVTSSYRTPEFQAVIFREAVRSHGLKGAQKWVALPGESNHQVLVEPGVSLANDIYWSKKSDRLRAHKVLAARYGMYFPYSWEPWHVEFRPNSTEAIKAADEHKIPREIFLAVIQVESRWNQYAISRCGALGYCQVMPYHIKSVGSTPKEFLADPKFQFKLGAKLLRGYYDRFGRWDSALAAYNAGPNAVSKYHGIPPYKETRNYVKNVLWFSGYKM